MEVMHEAVMLLSNMNLGGRRMLLAMLLLPLLAVPYSEACLRTTARILPLKSSPWGRWSVWSKCSVTCGEGFISRRRKCVDVPGLDPCDSPEETELRTCILEACPTDMAPWTSWSVCSATCDSSGFSQRSRQCTGARCRELIYERRPCPTTRCPVHGAWTQWSPWGPCSTTCGDGSSFRERSCTNPRPQHGGRKCTGAPRKARTCFPQRSCDQPLDGAWSSWSTWTTCSKTCGNGIRTRQRTCNNPAPTNGGRPCPGSASETTNCTLAKYCGPAVDGAWSSWGAWTLCSKTCEIGTRSRKRVCDSPAPENGGRPCPGSASETSSCTLTKYCGPPVNGGWSPWRSWSVCSVRCGNGTSTRVRLCDSPEPRNGGASCPGPEVERRPCFLQCAVDGKWSSWTVQIRCRGHNGGCSKGRRLRVRVCNNPAPAYGGLKCQGMATSSDDCWDDSTCPAGLSKPLDFSSKSHDNMTAEVNWREAPYGLRATNFAIFFRREGTTGSPNSVIVRAVPPSSTTPVEGRRYRRLVNLAEHRGRVQLWVEAQRIAASRTERKATAYHVLVVGETDGGWSDWTQWSACPVTCGAGHVYRRRLCNNPSPSSGGRPCSGSSTQRRLCDSGRFCTR